MLALFYVPWAVTLIHPFAGFVATTITVVYHWLYHRDIVQRIELSLLPGPLKMLTDYQERHASSTDSKTACCQQAKPRESSAKVEKDGMSQEGSGETRRSRSDSEKRSKVQTTVNNPYVWSYSQWSDKGCI